jgi:phosphatidylglycerol---prolipoprotein diacylglyceryl transferase
MFPTLSSLINYLFGTTFSWSVPTFGVFVALAFISSYFVFLSEFKRKEKEGKIKPVLIKADDGKKASAIQGLLWLAGGFILVWKIAGILYCFDEFRRYPFAFILSLKGSWLWGAVGAVLVGTLFYINRKILAQQQKSRELIVVHPYQLMPKMIVWAAIWGFMGAKLFNYLENIQYYSQFSFTGYLQNSGLTFLGGLIFGGACFFYIGYKNGVRVIDLADIGSPGMLVAYGVGRIGCHLSGDGDWGIVNLTEKPWNWLPDWIWSSRYPHNVLNAGDYIPGCSGSYCAVLPQGVYPTSFYECVLILLCFAILWLLRKRMTVSGTMFSIYLLLMGVERFFIEYLRINHRYQLWLWQLSEAQIISILFIVSGLVGLYLVVCGSALKQQRER